MIMIKMGKEMLDGAAYWKEFLKSGSSNGVDKRP
jgi:hypothetical protein